MDAEEILQSISNNMDDLVAFRKAATNEFDWLLATCNENIDKLEREKKIADEEERRGYGYGTLEGSLETWTFVKQLIIGSQNNVLNGGKTNESN